MNMSDHPDFDALSAYHDGEEADLAEHVASCPACAATLETLTGITGAVAAPVTSLGSADVDNMVRHALVTQPVEATPDIPRPVHQSNKRGWAMLASAAAAVLVAGGLVGILTRTDHEQTTASRSAAGPATSSSARQLQPPLATGDSVAGDSPVEGGDLGEIADGRDLLARVAPTLGSNDSFAGAASPSAASSEAGSVPEARVVGTRACETEARATDPSTGALVYVAEADNVGTPAKVLGFASPAGGRPITLFLMAQDGCRLIATATLP
jgi:hypothetical protein